MKGFASLLLVGATALQAVSGRPNPETKNAHRIARRDASSYLSTEVPYARTRLLCNIGSTGCAASGAASGIVIASPSTSSPDCEYQQQTKSATLACCAHSS